MISEIVMRLFILAIFVFLTVQADDFSQFPNDINQSSSVTMCQDAVSLNTKISNIDPNFISGSSITCLNLTNNYIENIENGAFEKLPNLTYLYLSHNILSSNQLFSFGNHKKLKVLIMNKATRALESESIVEILKYHPNLEILSLRGNGFKDIHFSEYVTDFTYISDASRISLKNRIPFPKLKILDLSSNNMRGIDFIELLPNSLYSLDLHNNQLSFFALNTKEANLYQLNLNNNNLESIKKITNYNDLLNNPYNNYDTTYQYPSWRQIGYLSNRRYQQHNLNSGDIGNGYYQNIKYGLGLASLKNLHYLSVSENRINYIESTAFQDTNKLIYLNLSRNNIKILDPDTFAKLQSLKTLDLSANDLTYVPQISAKTNISNLYLSCNKIERIISNTFVQTPNLTKLLLGGNQISEIDSKAFAYLSILEILDLSKNELNFLPEGWTKSLTSLRQLDLSDNEITSLEYLPLASALSLVEVYLAMNKLEYLNPTYFETLPRNVSIKLVESSSFSNWNLFCTQSAPIPIPQLDF